MPPSERVLMWDNTRLCYVTLPIPSSNVFGCEFLEDTVVLGVALLVLGPFSSFLVYKLYQVNDAFKVRRECLWVFRGTIFFIGERTRGCFRCSLVTLQRGECFLLKLLSRWYHAAV